MIGKKEIRKQIRERKTKLSLKEIENHSDIIINNLITRYEYIHSKTIFTYVSFNQEVITKNLIEKTFKTKRVAVPKIVDDQMVFFYIESLDELAPGVKGILEPVNTADSNIAIPQDGDLSVVPGLAFDNKNRMVMVGVTMISILINTRIQFHKIALAFDFQN